MTVKNFFRHAFGYHYREAMNYTRQCMSKARQSNDNKIALKYYKVALRSITKFRHENPMYLGKTQDLVKVIEDDIDNINKSARPLI